MGNVFSMCATGEDDLTPEAPSSAGIIPCMPRHSIQCAYMHVSVHVPECLPLCNYMYLITFIHVYPANLSSHLAFPDHTI
jgi:hypothetical protein